MALQPLSSGVFKRDERYFSLLRRQARLCRTSAQALWRFTSSEATATSTMEVVEQLEQEGWQLASELESLLTRTLSTPIDREDLHAVARRMGLLLDRTSHTVHACALLDEVHDVQRDLAEAHVHAMEKLERALDALSVRAYEDAVASAREARRIGTEHAVLDEHGREPAGSSRTALVTTEVADRFAALFRATRNAGDLVSRLALKQG